MIEPIRILALHRNPILREGIAMLIGMQDDMELVASVDVAGAAVHLFGVEKPDVMLLDLDLPAREALRVLAEVRRIDPHAKVIGLITDDWEESVTRAIDAGATSVLAKDLIGDLLPSFIRGANAGKLARELAGEWPPQS